MLGSTLGQDAVQQMPEERLWQVVLARTIEEWMSGPLRQKREAEEYLFNDNEDFLLVCQSAGMDPGRLRTQLRRLQKQGVTGPGASAHTN